LSDTSSKKAFIADTSDSDTSREAAVSALPPSVKVYKPEIHGGIRKSISSSWYKTNDESEITLTKTDLTVIPDKIESSIESSTAPDISEYSTDISDSSEEHNNSNSPVLTNIDSEVISEDNDPEPEKPLYQEDPIPSLFEGIGRTNWSDLMYDSAPGANDNNLPVATDLYNDTSSESDEFSLPDDDNEPEIDDDDVDVDELLDLIDDIEFSDLEPEPLKAVKYASEKKDPYNLAFNNPFPDSDDSDDVTEFTIDSTFSFEKK